MKAKITGVRIQQMKESGGGGGGGDVEGDDFGIRNPENVDEGKTMFLMGILLKETKMVK